MIEEENYQNFEFNRQQYETLQVLFVDVRNHAQSDPQEDQKFAESFDSFDDSETSRWNSDEVDFFDPMYDDKFSLIDNSIEHANKDTYFRDVHLFTERIKNMIVVKGAKLTRQNLYICLREFALAWYIDVLNDDQKRLVKLGEEVEEWERALFKRWKESSITAMTMIIKKRYIMENARKHREFFEFAQIIIREVKSTLMSVFSQIYLIYNDLKLKFRRDLSKSSESTTMNAFLQELKDNKEIWWNLDSRHRYAHQLPDSSRVQSNYRSSEQVDNYINFYSFTVRQSSDVYYSVEFNSAGNVTSSRQTQYSTFYQFERQNTAYRPSQQNQFQSSYQYRSQQSQQNQDERAQSYGNQQFRSQFASFDQQQNASDSRFQFFRFNFNLAEVSFDNYISSKQETYFNQQVAPNREFKRTYFTNETNENLFSCEREDYQNDYNENSQNASNQKNQEDAYHDQDDEIVEESKVSYDFDDTEEYFANTSIIQVKVHTCRRCQSEFYFSNKFHRHLRKCQIVSLTFLSSSTQNTQSFQDEIILFSAKLERQQDLSFRFYRYVTMKANIEKSLTNMCVDTDCEVSLIDKIFLSHEVSDYVTQLRQALQSLKVREIDDVSMKTAIYISLKFRISGTDVNGKSTIDIFTRRVYVVKSLKTKILLSNDILEPEKMSIDVNKRILTMNSCKNLKIQLSIVSADSTIKRVVRASEVIKISVKSLITILFKLRGKSALSVDRDFMFHFARIVRLDNGDDVLSHIIDAHIEVVQVQNTNSEDVYIPKNSRLEIVQEYEKEDCYLVSSEYAHLAANAFKSAPRNWFKSILKMDVSAMAVGATMAASIESSNAKFATNFVAVLINLEMEIDNFASNLINFDFNFIDFSFSNTYHDAESISQFVSETSNSINEQILSIDITIYGDSLTRNKLTEVVSSYPELWHDDDFIVRIFSEEWMSIDIIFDFKIEATKMYSLSSADRKLVDEVFDKLHAQGRMEYISQSIFHDYFVFAVWRIVSESDESERKDRVIVDIRDLNKISLIDFYFMPLQADITSVVADCRFIFVFDATDFFHQWFVKIVDRHKLIVVSHREQKQFNVAVMKFKNFSLYVQRKIDDILRAFRDFARVYVNDIMIFSNTLEEHITHLHSMFQLLNSYDISLFSKKFFFDYSTVALLEQKMNAFDLTIATDKLKTIIKLDFPYSLKNLEIYLGLTEWLRGFVPFYAQKADALQRRKILLLRQSSFTKGTIRKIYSKRIVVDNSSAEKLESYRQLQEAFSFASFLIHFSLERVLYIDIDVSKRREFDAMIYHLKSDCNSDKSKRSDIESILFLFRMLNEVETKYWSIEFEMCELVWVVRRVRHMIEVAKHTIVIFTDHVANTFISKQIIMNSSNTNKLNLRLVRAFTYLSQFKLEVKYRSNKEHVIFDALFRLFSENGQSEWSSDDKLNFDIYHDDVVDSSDNSNCYAFQEILFAMSNEFRDRVKKEYQKEKMWRNMFEMLKALAHRNEAKITEISEERAEESSQDEIESVDNEEINVQSNEDEDSISKKLRTGINFALKSNEVIYHVDSNARRLCISVSMKHEIFQLAHDVNQHSDVHRCYERIASTLYVSRLSRKIRRYIEHCSVCQLTQIKRHRLYDELNSIVSFSTSFHIIIMDFIFVLPSDLDALLIVICKYSRRVTLIVDKKTYSASQWANALLDRLLITDWNISTAIISNRNPRFMSEMWSTFFTKLDTKLLTFIVYHFQTDGSSERINQTVKIALRYFIIMNPEINYVLALSFIQAQLNNALNVVTNLSSNEINYDFKVRDTLISLNNIITANSVDLPIKRLEYRQEAVDVIAFAAAKSKVYYDVRHTLILLKIDEYAYLRLHQDYQLSSKSNRKLSQQRCELFKVIRRVRRLTYELELPSAWRIHLVVFIVQLEFVLAEIDSYQRPRPHHFDSIEMKDDTDEYKSYEIEKLIVKRQRKYNKTWITQYLMRWVDYEPEYDEWRSVFALTNSTNLIESFELSHFNENSERRQRRRARR